MSFAAYECSCRCHGSAFGTVIDFELFTTDRQLFGSGEHVGAVIDSPLLNWARKREKTELNDGDSYIEKR